jgi:hypothetical protein
MRFKKETHDYIEQSMNEKRTLLICYKHKLAALELLKADGFDCDTHDYGLQVEHAHTAKETLKRHNIESIIHQ